MPEKKLTKCSNFTRFLPEKIVFARIWGYNCPPVPVSYAYVPAALDNKKILHPHPDPDSGTVDPDPDPDSHQNLTTGRWGTPHTSKKFHPNPFITC